MSTLRIGTPDHLAARPLVFGLSQEANGRVELVHAEPGPLADMLDRRELDAALVPSIEFLRGAGAFYLPGPALVAGGRTRSLLLATQKALPDLERIAVGEYCRTPIAALRLVLDKLYGALPDFCVLKDTSSDWRTQFDGILLSGDRGLGYRASGNGDEALHDLGEMWHLMQPLPLVDSLWACNDEMLLPELTDVLTSSRDYSMKNLSLVSDRIAATSDYDGEFLYKFFSTAWGYHLGPEEEDGLRIFEDLAFDYRLIYQRRLGEVLAG